ncbi:response regulator [Peptostreptococcaceae bacterium AGR-M142]|jgi:two-component system chemotaxis response regulator CheY|nr:response regulator [Peptostreptococcaceae bacterium]
MKVLIVDDASFMRNFLKDCLDGSGFEVVGFARDGEEAIEKYKELKPDIVTMDINMPKMSGIEALQEIKKISKDVQIVMISDIGQHDRIIEAIKKGASDFIVKPVHPERLVDALKNLERAL